MAAAVAAGARAALLPLALLLAAAAAAPRGALAAGYACGPDGKPCCPANWRCPGQKLRACLGGWKQPSWLYGCAGEAWDRSRLPVDFSYAGYAAGERAIPWVQQGADVKAFGAKGDGRTDDSAAIERAIKSTQWGRALFFPPGKYVLTRRIDIRQPIVLRGAGKGRTTIYFPNALADVYGNRGGWGHGTCFLNFWGWDPVNGDTRLAAITAPAAKGADRVFVDNPGRIRPGSWVRIALADSSDAFKATLMDGLLDAGWPSSGVRNLVRFNTRVKAVSGNQVMLERGLPWEVKPQWSPQVHEFRPNTRDVGVEAMTFEFVWRKYPGHLKEDGLNAIHFNQLTNSWVHDVSFVNADTAIYWWGVTFSTVQDVEIGVTRSRASSSSDYWGGLDRNGHRAVWSEFGASNLFQRIAFKVPFYHDFTVASGETGDVFTDSWGADLNLDFHKGAPYTNLYTNLNLGAGTRAFRSGGGAGAGPNAGGGQTFWNVKASQALALPGAGWGGPLNNYVGVQTRDSAAARVAVRWAQDWATYPPNLWTAMRKRRLGW